MNIIVFGAGGRTGQEVVKQALDEGHQVTAFLRTPSKISLKHPNLTIQEGNARDEQAVWKGVEGQDAVISCLGTAGRKKSTNLSNSTANIINSMKGHGVERIAYMASAGIHKEIPGVTGIMAGIILRNVLADHKNAYLQLKDSNLKWTVARPLRLDNGPITREYRTSDEGVPSKGKKISRADVAHFLIKAVKEDTFVSKSIGLAY
ncbi:NAD(P)-dependent oxidoreductase [Pontibacillus yanchengensis]|uniref:Oxidoreductase n=1 Tax=Pontibacillus yanchengensis Y32 TaxID=1385514 RepID=A0A0A2TET3_9BACI|nr:SDR family oxidoreductase [Pontibacillus yanchengensis]KGP74074.1 oxidoreductase [Pontibacillus yanchengensis Y32]